MSARSSTSLKTAMANAYKGLVPNGALFGSDPGTANAATGELTGGAPAYARKALGWGTAAASAVTSAATPFDVASGQTVAYFGTCTSATAGTADVQDTYALTPQAFNSQGTYTVTATFTQS